MSDPCENLGQHGIKQIAFGYVQYDYGDISTNSPTLIALDNHGRLWALESTESAMTAGNWKSIPGPPQTGCAENREPVPSVLETLRTCGLGRYEITFSTEYGQDITALGDICSMEGVEDPCSGNATLCVQWVTHSKTRAMINLLQIKNLSLKES